MIITSTIAVISFSLMLFMFINKNKEMHSSMPVVQIGSDRVDRIVLFIKDYFARKIFVTLPLVIQSLFKKAVVMFETYIMNTVHRLSHKFAIVGEMVTGRDIPKNRGSVSFFLKNIEDGKKQTSL